MTASPDLELAAGLVEIDLGDMLGELSALHAAFEPIPDYAHDPDLWLADVLAEHIWSKQREIWRSVVDNTHTAVLSCNNSGKTRIASRVVAWWVSTYWAQGCRIVTTAPSAAQVRLLLWQEIANAFDKARDRKHPLPGRIVYSPYPSWKIGDEIVAFGRKPADHEQSAMQGTHAPHVLVVLDEAGGIGPAIWTAIEKITTTGHVSVLAIGNPDDPTAPFGSITQPGSGWHVIQVDGLRTPNFTRDTILGAAFEQSGRIEDAALPLLAALMHHERIPYTTEEIPDHLRPVMLQPSWVEGGLVRWCGVQKDETLTRFAGDLDGLGEYVARQAARSQLFTVAVRGDWPDGGEESVIPMAWVKRAEERWRDWDLAGQLDPVGRRIVGVDVATTNGADETAVAVRQGDVVQEVQRYAKGDTVETAERVAVHAENVAQAVAVVDVIGIGAGVRDQLRKVGVHTVGFVASAQSDRKDRHGNFDFLNDRAAAWWRLREMLDPAYGATLALPPDEKLRKELCAPKWKIRTGKGHGRIQIESKDDIRKRLGHSTDSADAVIQAVWIDGAPATGDDTDGAIPWGGHQDPALPSTDVAEGGRPRRRREDPGFIAYELNDPTSGGFE